jgi:hypothetical protein
MKYFDVIYILVIYELGHGAWTLDNVAEELHSSMSIAAWDKGKFTNWCKD